MHKIKFDFFSKVINNININIVDHGHFFGDGNWYHEKLSSPFNRLYMVIDGEGTVENSEHKVLMKPGCMYLIPLRTTYTYSCASSIQKLYIHFSAEICSGYDFFEASRLCMEKPLCGVHVPELLEMLKSQRIEDIVRSKALIMEAISRFIPDIPESLLVRMNKLIKYSEMYAYIRNNCSAGLSVRDISGYLGQKYSHLIRDFKGDNGVTLKRYISHTLMRAAMEKLVLTDLSIKEIAYSLKFSDEFYFSRFFKKHSGMSPKVYRQKSKV